MGCTGSKPHLLLSSTISSHHNHSTHHHHHHQSPQKGFILFNEKTFDYLKDNESEIKQKLIKRCEQKILTTSLDPKQQLLLMQAANASSGGTIGTSSISRALFSNAKRSLLPSLNEDKVKPNETVNTVSSVGATPTTPTNPANSSVVTTASPTNTKFKEMAIDAAVDYVLKYAINDFDIDNFKSSNHLSLKQIRKDIMKKTNNRESLTKINQALGSSGSNSNKTAIQHDMAYYKLALHTAIDEFGSFIQENFIVINEYQKKPESQKSDESKQDAGCKVNGADDTGTTGAISDEESLKLKEALELARQNFYKGKMSMVCLTKAGGYVVKEITEPTLDSLNTSTTSGKILSSATVDSLASTSMNNPQMSTSPTTCSDLLIAAQTSTEALSTSKSFNQSFNSSSCSDNKSQQTLPKINIEDVDTRQVSGVADTTTSPQQQATIPKSESVISNMSVKSLKLENSSDSQLSNTELNKLLNNTIELIVTYSTKPAAELRTVHTDLGELLEANLKHAGKLIRSTSLGHVDQQVVQNLDHVNKEFKNYLNILNESERLELKNITEELNSTSKDSIDKFVKRNSALLELSSQLDSAIVNAKSGKTSNGKKSKSKKTTAAPLPPPSTTNECIDIRKEIAISILNVGEVLAKTIDYYTLSDGGSAVSQSSANNQQVVGTEGAGDGKKHSEELKELLRISQEQAELERQQQLAKSEKDVSPKPVDKQEILNEIDQEHRTNESSVVTKPVSNSVSTTSSSPSFLSTPSPSASTAPSTPGSVSPITLPNADHDLKSAEVDTVQPHCIDVNGHNDELVTQTENAIEATASETTDILVNEFVSSIIDQAACQEQDNINEKETNGPVVYRSATKTASIKQNGSGSKRVSLDEELMYQLEQVDKKVKYMNETCSENESDGESDDEDRYYDHDLNYNRHRGSTQPKGNHSANGGEYNEDLDDENFDYDESVELGATGTPARQTAGLKQARTPAKIKSDIRQNRAVDLHEEIKQISNVIQDLVQTINVRNSTSQSNVNTLGSSSSNSQTAQDVSEQVHSLSSGSQSSTDCIDNSKSIDSTSSTKKAKFNTAHSFSSIPVRQKTSSSSLIKPVKAMSIDADHDQSTSPNSQLPARAKASPNRNSFDAASPAITPERQQVPNSKSAPNSAHSANRVFKSKLPVKK